MPRARLDVSARLLTTRECADRLGISVRTFHLRVRTHPIFLAARKCPTPGAVRYRESAIDLYIRGCPSDRTVPA